MALAVWHSGDTGRVRLIGRGAGGYRRRVSTDVAIDLVAAEKAGAGSRVLLVEDNDDIRFLLRFWLDEDDRCAEVLEAASCAEAISAADDGRIDAMVLDFMLAGGTSAQCLPQLRAAHPQARIVVYTANVAVAHQAGVLELGADALVAKMDVVVEDVVDLVFAQRR